MMNKFIVMVFYLLASVSLQAQTVTVTSQTEKVKDESVEGYTTELEGKKDEVNDAWIKYLKDIGKVRQSVDPVTLTEPTFNGLIFYKGIIYSVVKGNGEKTFENKFGVLSPPNGRKAMSTALTTNWKRASIALESNTTAIKFRCRLMKPSRHWMPWINKSCVFQISKKT